MQLTDLNNEIAPEVIRRKHRKGNNWVELTDIHNKIALFRISKQTINFSR